MTDPLFSILIANYNNGRFFEDCYNSIIAQTNKNWEAIIVDDCSTDDSVKTIEKFIEGDARFRLFVNESNKGCGYTKRRCAEKAKGELAAFLDPDDVIMPTAVEAMVKKHEEHPEASLVHSNLLHCDENLKERFINKPKCKDFGNYLKTVHHIFPFASFKTQKYLDTEGIAPELKRAVDQDLYYKLEETGKFVYLDNTLYKYRIHGGGISTGENELKAKAWHYLAIVDACKRRNESVEDILPIYIANRNYKVGEMLLKPLRSIWSFIAILRR